MAALEGVVITKAEFEARCEALREVGCLCCRMNLRGYLLHPTGQGVPEIHHLNKGGIAGNERRGDRYTVPLCPYHHRGVVPAETRTLGLETDQEALVARYGPSWAHGSKLFREFYPEDDELLAIADERIGVDSLSE